MPLERMMNTGVELRRKDPVRSRGLSMFSVALFSILAMHSLSKHLISAPPFVPSYDFKPRFPVVIHDDTGVQDAMNHADNAGAPSSSSSSSVSMNSLSDDFCTPGVHFLTPQPLNSQSDSIGVLFAMSGSISFGSSALGGVMHQLLDNLGIDADASKRPSDAMQWAMATDPYMCQHVISKLSPRFWNVLIVMDPQTDLPNVTLPSFLLQEEKLMPSTSIDTQAAEHQVSDHLEALEQTAYKLKKEKEQTAFGQGPKAERSTDITRQYVKALKVKAMTKAPFDLTVFLDLDMMPCRADFVHQLLANNQESQSFDLAITNVFGSQDQQTSKNDPKHYVQHRIDRLGKYNTHNSALVILNMTSETTVELLHKYEDYFFAPIVKPPMFYQIKDQPSLGRAIRDLAMAGKLTHVDLDDDEVCRIRTNRHWNADGSSPWTCATLPSCQVIHKPNM